MRVNHGAPAPGRNAAVRAARLLWRFARRQVLTRRVISLARRQATARLVRVLPGALVKDKGGEVRGAGRYLGDEGGVRVRVLGGGRHAGLRRLGGHPRGSARRRADRGRRAPRAALLELAGAVLLLQAEALHGAQKR